MIHLSLEIPVATAFSEGKSPWGSGANALIAIHFDGPEESLIPKFQKQSHKLRSLVFKAVDHQNVGLLHNDLKSKGPWQLLELIEKQLAFSNIDNSYLNKIEVTLGNGESFSSLYG